MSLWRIHLGIPKTKNPKVIEKLQNIGIADLIPETKKYFRQGVLQLD